MSRAVLLVGLFIAWLALVIVLWNAAGCSASLPC